MNWQLHSFVPIAHETLRDYRYYGSTQIDPEIFLIVKLAWHKQISRRRYK